jgi:hypothetical protein
MLLEGVTGNILIISLIVADLAVCLVVILYFFRGRGGEEKSIDTAKLKGLVHTLSDLVRESDRASRNLLDALNERHRKTEQLFREMDLKERQMTQTIREAECVTKKPDDLDRTTEYGEVSRLADLGLTADEIATRLKLPRGEIELVLGLKR